MRVLASAFRWDRSPTLDEQKSLVVRKGSAADFSIPPDHNLN